MGSLAAEGAVSLAQDVFRASTKCHTLLKLFPAYHLNCVNAIDTFVNLVLDYVALHEQLTVKVDQEELLVAGEVVYSSNDRSDNLALAFFMDGLRELTVLRGVTRQAAKQLVQVFHESLQQKEADCLMLLWEADIPFIDYVALNSLMDPWDPPDHFSPSQITHLKKMNASAEGIIGRLSTNFDCGELTIEPGPGAKKKTPKVRGTKRVRVALGDLLEEDVYESLHDELKELRARLVSWDAAHLVSNVVGHTLDGLALAPDIVTTESGEWLLRTAVDLAIDGRDIDLLADLLTRFTAERRLAEDGAAEAILERLFEWLRGPKFRANLIGMSRAGLMGDPRALCQVLDHLGPSGIETAVEIYTKAHSEAVGPTLFAFVSENLGRNPRALRPLLHPDVSAEVALPLVQRLAKVVQDDATITDLLNLARQHPDPQVVAASTMLWTQLTAQGQLTNLVDMLSSDNRMNRMSALSQLTEANNRRAVPDLKTVIDAPEFVTRDAEEREAFIDALWRLGGTAAIGFLQTQTKRRTTTLFHRAALKAIRESAQEALEKLRKSREQERPLGD